MSVFKITFTVAVLTVAGIGISLAAEPQQEDNSAAQNDMLQISIEKTDENKGVKITRYTNNTPTDWTCEPTNLGTTHEEFFEKLKEIEKNIQVFIPSIDGNCEGPCRVPTSKHPMSFAGFK